MPCVVTIGAPTDSREGIAVGVITTAPVLITGLPTLSCVAIVTGDINTTPVVIVGEPKLSALAIEAGTITIPPETVFSGVPVVQKDAGADWLDSSVAILLALQPATPFENLTEWTCPSKKSPSFPDCPLTEPIAVGLLPVVLKTVEDVTESNSDPST